MNIDVNVRNWNVAETAGQLLKTACLAPTKGVSIFRPWWTDSELHEETLSSKTYRHLEDFFK